ncbi:sigma-54 dependent transcriptional regulator [Gammaproteobacteria bacterium]|jgi:sigma-54 specific flagellar transcriptional regulator A|nr:sigma-54 dependent transcriptional regulator [Gammaproteobacteria bacterium]
MTVSKGALSSSILGQSESVERLRSLILQCASSDAPVLLRGETGSGKELVSRALHDYSPRAKGPFIAINCGAIPEQLLESELFGHRKGSFTGATCDRKGRFELANGGTLFLDEIGDMPSQLQVKFLRVLEEREVEPVGGGGKTKINVRIVAATHRNLELMVEEGAFRADLLYRLNVIPITIPPLSERSDDVPSLLSHFAQVHSSELDPIRFSERSVAVLQSYSWPGNVRELSNLVQRFSVLYPGQNIDMLLIPKEFLSKEMVDVVAIFESSAAAAVLSKTATTTSPLSPSAGLNEQLTVDVDASTMQASPLYQNDFEQIIELSGTLTSLPSEGVSTKELLNNLESNLIRLALDQTDGNVSKASSLLQLGRTSLIQKINKYQLGQD